MSRLVVVSNRVTPVTGGKAAQAGGLAVGVLDALRNTGGIWFGWSGEVAENSAANANVFRTGKITYITLDLSHDEFDGYYGGFSNRTLWPLHHYRLDLSTFDRDWYITYRRVNQLMAEHLMPYLRDDDLIWVHDYHLIPFAECLRELGLKARMGFFLHIPFPSPEIFLALPWHEQLTRAYGAYDLLGLQTEGDVENFLAHIRHSDFGRVDGHEVERNGHRFRVGAYPIGIDVDQFAKMAVSSEARKLSRQLSKSLLKRHLIIGVDRLDYTKGINERLRAFESLIQTYPEHRNQVIFMQISAPSREDVPEYMDMRREVEETSGRINGTYSDFDWVPLRYINRGFSRRILAGFFRISDVALVTPLRDGMNLVAKEFVAAQDPDDPGVLVLSRFAGAAAELSGALIVNPYDPLACAEQMHRGLQMPLEERQDRWRHMFLAIQEHDIARWREDFLTDLQAVQPHTAAA
ncbi:MAG: alpha,alpha-trehalose-phosphate synthase (UDP-forming) [Geminicoccaceae bacterium]